MKVSVVMATYNGEQYLVSQLDSINSQTLKPDEVLIFDDGSTDQTSQIIREFISNHNLESTWTYTVNSSNKGCVRNFVEGAMEASGDVVFYADQDDVWHVKKLEEMIRGFEIYPDMMACYCLRHYIDNNGLEIPIHFEFMNNVRVKTRGFQKVSLNEAIKYNKSPGLCLAIRKVLLEETQSMILDNGLTHDLPIGTVAAIHDGYYVLNKRLVYYRQHAHNLSAPRITVSERFSKMDQQIVGRELRLSQMEVVLRLYSSVLSDSNRANFEAAIEETRMSIQDLRSRNLRGLIRAIVSSNPMMNRWIAINNLMACLFWTVRTRLSSIF